MILPRPNTGQQSPTTTGPLRRAHLRVYGSELAFESQQGRNIKKIVDYADGSIENRDDWPRYIAWFIDAQRRLRKAVETAGGIPA
ncbi:DUF4268 domain-containing protein [Mycobacteroides abscessus]|uniref:DUF4268 domain-containing protein n=1 Tax=Mycobacteroides abscessus TaxID=36809 RepID=UPI00210779B9|nr:DUF4268 domain-containing protein [Mycobacteroides abscessus]